MSREISHIGRHRLIGAVYHPPKANNAEMMDYLIGEQIQLTEITVILGFSYAATSINSRSFN